MHKKRRSAARKSRRRSKSQRATRKSRRRGSPRKSRQRSKSPVRKSVRKPLCRPPPVPLSDEEKNKIQLQRKYLEERSRGKNPRDYGGIIELAYIVPTHYDFAYFSVENLSFPDVDQEASDIVSNAKTKEEKGEKIVLWLAKKIENAIDQLIEKIIREGGKYEVNTVTDDIDNQTTNFAKNIYLYQHYEDSIPRLRKLREVFDGLVVFRMVHKKFRERGIAKNAVKKPVG